MVEGVIVFVYVLFFISMVCSITLTVKLCMSGKNYLIAVLSGAMALCELIVLTGVVWIEDFANNVPKEYCIFQGVALQYSIYLQIVSALCFSFHIYQLLVCCKQGMVQKKVYAVCITVVPIVMTIVVAVVSVRIDAIKPFTFNCDVKKPVWVRLIGYSGFNFILTFIGVYLSARAAFEVFRHLDRFKAQISSKGSNLNISNDNNDTKAETSATLTPRKLEMQADPSGLQKQIKSYNMTRTAAIRMVLFSCGFALINFAASIQTILLVIRGDELGTEGLRGNDIAGALMGTIIYLVFGLPRNVKKFFCSTKNSRRMVSEDNNGKR